MKTIINSLAFCFMVMLPIGVIAQNHPPEITRIEILPNNPTLNDDLTCSYDYYDVDGDPENTDERFVAWQRNGVWQTQYRDQLTIPASATGDNELWEVFLRVHDGTDESETYTASVTFGTPEPNTIPEANDVQITPSTPLTNDNLLLSYNYYDADGDAEDTGERFIAWQKDGAWTLVHREMIEIPASDTRKGETWQCILRVHDGTDYSAEYWADPVTIGNTPPEATVVSLTPLEPAVDEDIVAQYTYSDADGDPESGTEIRWYRDDVLDPAFNDQLVIPGTATVGGETWYFTVHPMDGENYGDLQTSNSVIVGGPDYSAPTAAFDADPTIGFGPIHVQFYDRSKGQVNSYHWNFGDGTTSRERNPEHTYETPGIYNVTLTISNPHDSDTKTAVGLIEVFNEDDYVGYSYLKVVEQSHCWHDAEDWDNAIDRDTYGWSGTTNAGPQDAWAIFCFEDEMVHTIHKARMMTDTGVPNKMQDYVKKFRLFASTESTEDSDFTLIGEFENTERSGWNVFEFTPVSAKYIRIAVVEPVRGWRQVGEFEIYEQVVVPEISGSTVEATTPHYADGIDQCVVKIHLADNSGNPVSGVYPGAFRIVATGENNYYNPVYETDVPGTYQGSFTSNDAGEKTIVVYVYNKLIEFSSLESQTPVVVDFLMPQEAQGSLQFVEGTRCWENEGWENAIDGDIEGWDGTVSAGPKWRDCYGIYEFTDQTIKNITKYSLITDTGVGWEKHWVTDYQLWISTSGVADADFQLVHEHSRTTGDWEEVTIQPVLAKYIKLQLLEPRNNWRQIGEFQVFVTHNQSSESASILENNSELSSMPTAYNLLPNYPNPFNPTTFIQYELPEESNVTIRIFDIQGREVCTLMNGKQNIGRHTIMWDGKDALGNQVTSGIYIYQMDASNTGNSFKKSQKMTLIK